MRALVALLLLSLFTPLVAAGQALSWSLVQKQIRTAFPDVPQLSTEALAAWLADDARPAPLLLDVRAEEEYAVSHLPGAHHFAPETTDFAALDDLPHDTPLVLYCSVGYRSSKMAERLRAAGFTAVMNLEGSIFQWANEGRPVYRGDSVVQNVHPYDARWGLLLEAERRAPIES